jgi:hypothetical protein
VSIIETQAPVAPALVGVTLPAVTATVLPVTPATVPGTTYTYPAPPVAPATVQATLNSGSTYTFAVTATTLAGTTVAATTGLTNSPTVAPVVFGIATDTSTVAGSGSITLTWANAPANKNNVAGLLLTWQGGSKTFAPTTTGATVIGLTPSTLYSFSLQAVSNVAAFNSAVVGVTATAP